MNAGSFVVDASVAIKWYLPAGSEPFQAEAVQLLNGFVEGKLSLHAPELIAMEVGNVLGRRAPHPETHFDEFLALPLLRHPSDDTLLRRALRLQTERSVILFDAVYLALAERLAIPLVTDDRDLIKASKGSAVSLDAWKKAG